MSQGNQSFIREKQVKFNDLDVLVSGFNYL